jgi:hypothetical protein
MTPEDPSPSVPVRRAAQRHFSQSGTPRPPDLQRVRRAGTVHRARRERRRSGGESFSVSRELVIGGALILLLALVGGGLWVVGRMMDKGADQASVRAGSGSPETARVWRGPHPFEVVKHFTTAPNHAERLKWVRQPERVGAAMEWFFLEGPGAREKVKGTVPMTVAAGGEVLYENYLVELEGGGRRWLSVSVDPEGAKVDFDAYARTSSESWEDLLSGRVEAVEVMRLNLRPGGFYLHAFPDESRWLHFKATTPDLAEGLDLYVERGSLAESKLVEQGEQIDHMTLSLRAVGDGARHRQFEISEVKAAGWVLPD